jgi:hypothetical protein
MLAEVQLEYLMGRDNLVNLGVEERALLNWILQKYGIMGWTVLVWFKFGTSGRLL